MREWYWNPIPFGLWGLTDSGRVWTIGEARQDYCLISVTGRHRTIFVVRRVPENISRENQLSAVLHIFSPPVEGGQFLIAPYQLENDFYLAVCGDGTADRHVLIGRSTGHDAGQYIAAGGR
jgi:hypothetical protein